MNIWFLLAGSASALTMLIHCILGGREIARPLLDATDIHAVAKYTNYYCWHLVSLTLAAMAGSFFWAAFHPEGIELAVLATFLSTAFCVWNLGLVTWKKQRFSQMPQWALFLAITVLALPGFWG
ncbi:hypothetical protein [Kordiimonas lacus]|uniref:DUF423 domain-containing protein n=1 Tax=Kordiimonas lacus TaxID=637679 RepID=A0A1G6ZNN2_9PROT|nr:hypothetical protein [Kordiimonas lacus]SDE03475.1 hypothetical protein SAMN04488071_1866 [Kordiimonas lacus]